VAVAESIVFFQISPCMMMVSVVGGVGSAGPAHGQLLGSLVIGGSVGPHDLRCRGGICQSEHAIRILTSPPSVCSSLFSAPPALSSSRCPRSVTSATARRSAMATPSTPTSARTPMTRCAHSHNPSLDPATSHIPLPQCEYEAHHTLVIDHSLMQTQPQPLPASPSLYVHSSHLVLIPTPLADPLPLQLSGELRR